MQFRAIPSTIAAVLALSAAAVSASPITPSFTSFGTLAGATFGGSGIPNDAVAALTSITDLTLGLTAHQRYSNPALGNDNAGTFFANAGVDTNAPSPANPYAIWNFAFYVGGAAVGNYSYKLFYDFDPAAGNDETGHGAVAFTLPSGVAQDSWNLGMDFLDVSAGAVTQPVFASFDPNAGGQYTFALVAYEANGAEAGRTAIQVNVNAVPEPGSLALVGAALLGITATRRRKA